MTTQATRIRDAIYERFLPLVAAGAYFKVRRVPIAMLQPDQLPALTVSLLSDRGRSQGDDNAGEIRFDNDVTIGISDVRQLMDPEQIDDPEASLEELIARMDIIADDACDLLERMLLTDPDFTRFGPDTRYPVGDARREPFFEAVTALNRSRSFPQQGETFLVETRIEITFRTSSDFAPVIPDDFRRIKLKAKPLGSTADTPETGLTIVEEVDDD